MEELIEPLVKFLKVIADSTRLKIINLLKSGEKTANTIQASLAKSQSTISQQLKILTNADILVVRREGVKKFFKIKDPQIFEVISSISDYLSHLNKEKIDTLTSLDVLDTLH